MLVVGRAADSEDFAVDSIIHSSVAAHRVGISSTSSSSCLAASAGCAVPVHSLGGTRLEDVGVFPAEEPAVVVGAVDALRICSEHGRYGAASEKGPCVGGRVVEFAVFAALAAGPGGADDEDVACGGGGLGLVAAGDVHCLVACHMSVEGPQVNPRISRVR